MVTVYRAYGLRFIIFTDDHEPAHVHVFGGGQMKVTLMGQGDAPELAWADGMKHSDIRRAMEVIVEQRDVFLARWRKIHDRPD